MATKSSSQISTIGDDTEAVAVSDTSTIETLVGSNQDSEMSGKLEVITIHSSSEESDAVPVGVNGYLYQIPRDKPIKVPTEVVQILRDSVVTSYKPGPGGTQVARSTPRYAFSSTPA